MTFRPTFWATVATITVLAVLLGLGTWQLDRRAWKQELIAARAERLAAPALDFADATAAAHTQLDQLEFRAVNVPGEYRQGADLKLLSRTRDGRPGFHVVTPFVAAPGGETVLVDRGWVPIGGEAEMSPPPQGPTTVLGYVRRFETAGLFTPDNAPAQGEWFYLDRTQLAAALGAPALVPFYIQRAPGSAAPVAYPAGGVPTVAARNNHLQYALTWYALALSLLAIYVVFHLRRPSGKNGSS